MKSLQYYSISLGNLLRGATDTPRQRLPHGPLALTDYSEPVIIKKPVKYDLSHWEKVLTWTGMNPRPVDVYTKATEGTNYQDPTFPEYMAGMLSIGAKRGAYHFNRKAYDPIAQAKWFLAYVKPYIDVNTRLILDVEENDTPADTMVKWFEYVISQRPNNPVALYGRAEQLNRITMNASQRAFMKTIPVIVAGYPTYPNSFDTIPAAYIPDQTKYGKVTDWQYSELGSVEGIDGDVDLNMIIDGGTDETPPPTGDKMQYKVVYANGVNRRTGPSTSYSTTGTPLKLGDVVDVLRDDIPDAADPTNTARRWVQFADFSYGASMYDTVRMEKVVETPPPADDTVIISVNGVEKYKVVGKLTVL